MQRPTLIWRHQVRMTACCLGGLVMGPAATAQGGIGQLLPQVGGDESATAKLILLITVVALAPAFLAMVTSFTRIVVVLYFLRSAIGAQDIPPNQVLLGLALFLTFFTMRPVLTQVHEEAIQPYFAGEVAAQQAIEAAEKPLREFMFKHARAKDISLFVRLGKLERPETRADLPTSALIPAFIISELRTAFTIGFIIYLPFLVIDLVVASTLVTVGAFMLPPVVVSLPFKLLVFVLIDGWHLLAASLGQSFL
ncbi:MAG: flagellar type III secretion system pore protein FliP [Armatimonadota bacterium]